MIDTIGSLPLAEHEMPISRPYRTSLYTVREYARLPHAEQVAVNRECDRRTGLVFKKITTKAAPPFVVGRRRQATR